MVGSGAIMVLDEDTSIVKALEVVLRFYAHESCGQCPPCREGTYWLYEIVHRIREGKVRAYKVGGKTMVDPKSARAFRRSRPLTLAAQPLRKPQNTSKSPNTGSAKKMWP